MERRNQIPGELDPAAHSDSSAPSLVSTTAIAQTEAFRILVRNRARFTIPVAILGFGAYLVVIVLSGFSHILNNKAIGPLSWTAVLTALIFPLVWLLCDLYRRRAARWDDLAAQAVADGRKGGASA